MMIDSGASEHAVANASLLQGVCEVEQLTVVLADRSETMTRLRGRVWSDLENTRLVIRSAYYIPDLQLNHIFC